MCRKELSDYHFLILLPGRASLGSFCMFFSSSLPHWKQTFAKCLAIVKLSMNIQPGLISCWQEGQLTQTGCAFWCMFRTFESGGNHYKNARARVCVCVCVCVRVYVCVLTSYERVLTSSLCVLHLLALRSTFHLYLLPNGLLTRSAN